MSEYAILEAAYKMAIESLSPDDFDNFEEYICRLHERRNLGKPQYIETSLDVHERKDDV